MKNVTSLAIVLLVLGLISTIGSYLVQEEGLKAWFYALALLGQTVGILVICLENQER
jgi:hypothetical protein